VSENQFKEDLHEYSLFILHDPEKAQELAEQVLPLLEEWKIIPDISIWWMPRSYYLAGLSYELAGNQEKAIEIYWQLWHDFPDSHYARLAEFKLEPISP
jgi:tetratricopeptide (TPR) repeat protein